ncbi:MAG TPA: prepilin-type N-terminal cleavage/methylation domain-containing protein [Actinomycetota bacterium]
MPRTSAREDGFTLVELVITGALMMVVLAAMLGIFSGLQRSAVRQASRSETADQVRLTMDRMIKEIRQSTAINAASTASYLDMETFIGGTPANVVYDATTPGILKRTEDGVTLIVLERLTVNALWTYSPDAANPSTITVTLTAKPEKFLADIAEVSLASEVERRNR